MELYTFRFLFNGKLTAECYDAYNYDHAVRQLRADYGLVKFELVE